jgi:ATP-dependent DNA helicase RecG
VTPRSSAKLAPFQFGRITPLIDPDEIERLLGDLESDRVERTESVDNSVKFCKAICAFANDLPAHRAPGYLCIGVDKFGAPTSTPINERLLEALASHRSNGQIIPMPTMEVAKVDFRGVPIAVVKVEPSDLPPVRYQMQTWIRVGPSARLATQEEERRLTERRVDRARTWDLQACVGASLDDLALDLFRLTYLPQAVSPQVIEDNGRPIDEQLGSLRFYHQPLGAPTNGAMLLFGKDPVAFVPGAYVQYVRYEGESQATDVLVERRFDGDLLQVMRSLDQLARDVAGARPVRQTNLGDTTVQDYPEIALHELLMNAVVHRNYDNSTTPISINHFSDRIEIQNPGSLFGDLTRGQFPNGVSYRNPVLAEAAKTLGFVNRFGRGVAVAQQELTQNGSPPLEYLIGENHMLMTVRKRP